MNLTAVDLVLLNDPARDASPAGAPLDQLSCPLTVIFGRSLNAAFDERTERPVRHCLVIDFAVPVLMGHAGMAR